VTQRTHSAERVLEQQFSSHPVGIAVGHAVLGVTHSRQCPLTALVFARPSHRGHLHTSQ
jgi:hypothetical protein